MSKPRTVIDQKLCRKAEMMFKDPKATVKEVAELLGVSPATMSRICTAGFSVEQYEKNNAERNKKEKGKLDRFLPMEKLPLAQQQIRTDNLEEECQGQISMDLRPAEEEKQEMTDQTKLMRFLAGKFTGTENTIQITMGELILHIGKIEDYLAQILRRMDK